MLHALVVALPTWLEDLQKSYSDSPQAQQQLQALALQTSQGHYYLDQGTIKYKHSIWLGHSEEFPQQVTEQLHASPIGGHSSYLVTYQRIRKLFYWPHMKNTIKSFVEACSICQQAKAEHIPYPGLLQPLPVPDQAWKVVTMDFIEGLPTSNLF
jgi:hypothetical protein